MPSSAERKRGNGLKRLRTAGTVTAVAMLSLGAGVAEHRLWQY